MTREELKAHCLKQIEGCEMWARLKGEEPRGKVYEEHKLILELLEHESRKEHWEHGKELCKEYQGKLLVDVTYADWHCSNCGYVIEGTVKPKWNYCPNCGADMRGTKE